MHDKPRFERERIVRRGLRTGEIKLVKLGQVREYRSIRYEPSKQR